MIFCAIGYTISNPSMFDQTINFIRNLCVCVCSSHVCGYEESCYVFIYIVMFYVSRSYLLSSPIGTQ